MFQAYIITCVASGKRYVGITSTSLHRRWIEHVSNARRRPKGGALYAAIQKYGRESFTILALCESQSWADLCAVEPLLIRQWNTLAPKGYNLSTGGEGRYGFRPSAESVERSAAKHRGKPCHPNTREASSRTHKGVPKSADHRDRIASGRRGKIHPPETKAKIAAYWAARRERGDFQTARPYEHRKAQHIARSFKP